MPYFAVSDFTKFTTRIADIGNCKGHEPCACKSPPQYESAMHAVSRASTDTLTFAILWYSLFRTDQREAISRSKSKFVLEKEILGA